MPKTVDPVDLTCRLIDFDTVNPPGSEEAAARFLGELMLENGLEVNYQGFAEGRLGLVACLKGESTAPALCFTGHLDTVPPGAAAWQNPPLKSRLSEGRIYGRGASDMKSGLAAMTAAVLKLAEMPRRRADVVMVFTAGEETGSEGASHMAREGVLPRHVGALVVGEPSGNTPYLGHKGAFWLRCRARGKAAHGSMPDQGDNAILKAVRAVLALENLVTRDPPHAKLGHPTLNVGTIGGGTKINMVPDLADFTLDLRTVPGVDHKELYRRVCDCIGKGLEVDRLVDLPPVLTDETDPWVLHLLQLLDRRGAPSQPGYVNYFTDASVFTQALGDPPTVILGPGEAIQAHQTDEWCRVEKILQAVDIYLEIASHWCGVAS
jgi:succinyl-diaminopimelate desuccinylase